MRTIFLKNNLFAFRALLITFSIIDLQTGTTSNFIVNHLPYIFLLLTFPKIISIAGIQLENWQTVWISIGLVFHPIGAVYSFYADYWFYDSIAHFYSSTLISSLGLSALWKRNLSRRKTILAGLIWILLMGTTWEVFERTMDELTVYGPRDTAGDYIANIAGYLATLKFGKKRLRNIWDK